ncbi:hypothetical protein [Megasphaera stantonii]|uniref:hypothetical protein n=1 Tax=Megasphaera stantonii TaxID=2144175 RepID=UPI00294296B3|nr:hypothetical protein [Megasphaera stantonii]
MKRTCDFCGSQFVPVEKKQRFCSARCCHYYHNRIGNDHIQHAVKPPENRILRTFRCRQCGRVVYVTEKEDKRQRFCSVACSRNYHRHERRRDSGRASGGRAY